METKPIIISEEHQGQRLDKFLAEALPDKTRSQIQKLVKRGGVAINGRTAKVHHFLKVGDIISFVEIKEAPAEKKSTPALKAISYKLIPEIIFEDNDYLIIDKPVGLLVHPTDAGETDTLADWLKENYPGIENVGEQKYRAGIIHRLDKDVSGVMVVAKNNEAFSLLKDQFKRRKVNKEYLAIVYGKVSQPEGEIDLPIGRNPDGQFVAHPRQGSKKFQDTDKVAKTRYRVIQYLKGYTELAVEILTGRTHQIRAHLFASGYPIVGDAIYKPRKKIFNFLQRKIKVIEPGRIFLHSRQIGFADRYGQWREFSSPIPNEITAFINEKRV